MCHPPNLMSSIPIIFNFRLFNLLALLAVWVSTASAQAWDGLNNGNANGNENTNIDPNFATPSSYFPSSTEVQTVTIAHAVTACIVWAFLMPVGGILLRLDIRSPWIVRMHMVIQVSSYCLFVASVGMGIWLIKSLEYGTFTMWTSVHPQLGLAILALASFQPILGVIHHRIFKRRQAATIAATNTSSTPPNLTLNINPVLLSRETQLPTTTVQPLPPLASSPSTPTKRTLPGYAHLWLGRTLILLGIINGGLGIRLAGQTPFQDPSTTYNATIGYSIGVAIVALVYIGITARFEIISHRRRRHRQNSAVTSGTAEKGERPGVTAPFSSPS